MLYQDRHDAGVRLANELRQYNQDPDAIVLALPRGGVPVAYEVAQQLQLPLDIFIVRKLGVPNQKELAMGAITSGEAIFFNEDIISSMHISQNDINRVIEEEKIELKRRELNYREGRPFPNLTHKKIILIDDGIATGATMHCAIIALKKLHPKEIIIAVPVAPDSAIAELTSLVDHVICLHSATTFFGVGSFYSDFSQTTDEEVKNCL